MGKNERNHVVPRVFDESPPIQRPNHQLLKQAKNLYLKFVQSFEWVAP